MLENLIKKILLFTLVTLFIFGISALPLKNAINSNSTAFADRSEDEEVNGDDSEDEVENEQEDEHEEEDEHEDESSEVEEKVQNQNGTTSTIQRKVEDNGSIKLKIKTFSTSGDLIEEKEYENEDEEAELKIKQFDNFGNKLLELKYKNENGNEIKLQIKGSTTGESKVKYDFENQKMLIETESEDELEIDEENEDEIEIEVENSAFKIKHRNSAAYINFPITVDEETGKVFVNTGIGQQVELKSLPDEVIEKALASGEIDEANETEIEEENEQIFYSIDGDQMQKILGLFEVDIEKTLIYDIETGELIKINLDPINQILDILSF